MLPPPLPVLAPSLARLLAMPCFSLRRRRPGLSCRCWCWRSSRDESEARERERRRWEARQRTALRREFIASRSASDAACMVRERSSCSIARAVTCTLRATDRSWARCMRANVRRSFSFQMAAMRSSSNACRRDARCALSSSSESWPTGMADFSPSTL